MSIEIYGLDNIPKLDTNNTFSGYNLFNKQVIIEVDDNSLNIRSPVIEKKNCQNLI